MKMLYSLVLFCAVSTPAFAAFIGPSATTINNVQEAIKASDDTPIMLTGYITQSLGNEDYLFKDATGEIKAEIDHESWQGQDVSPRDTVVIYGEVDNDWNEKTIDVDRIVKK